MCTLPDYLVELVLVLKLFNGQNLIEFFVGFAFLKGLRFLQVEFLLELLANGLPVFLYLIEVRGLAPLLAIRRLICFLH